jgi:hypothetical protein
LNGEAQMKKLILAAAMVAYLNSPPAVAGELFDYSCKLISTVGTSDARSKITKMTINMEDSSITMLLPNGDGWTYANEKFDKNKHAIWEPTVSRMIVNDTKIKVSAMRTETPTIITINRLTGRTLWIDEDVRYEFQCIRR